MESSLKVSSASATGNPRNKVALKPGRSLMDWIRLTNTTDLSGTGGVMRTVTLQELSQHNRRDDAWLAIRGLVYNVTSYFEFHPGGEEELIKGVGIDATDVFDQVHKWVNYESMLKKCLVGRLKVESAVPASKRPPSDKAFSPPRLPAPTPLATAGVTIDWTQTPTQVAVVLYTRQKGLDARRVSIAVDDGENLNLRVFNEDRQLYDFKVKLAGQVEPDLLNLSVSASTGKIELSFKKKQPGTRWQSVGDVQVEDPTFRPFSRVPLFFRRAVLNSKSSVNHNVRLFSLTFPRGHRFYVPVGWHVQLKLILEDGSELIRNYTPVPASLIELTSDCPSQVDSNLTLYFLIKIYPAGPFTSHLDKLVLGSTVEVSDPIGTFDDSQLDGKNFVALAAGTGITPMIRPIIDALKSDRRVSLVFFNRTLGDAFWLADFDDLKSKYPDTLQVWHVLSEPDEDWSGLRGRISSSILATTIESVSRDPSSFLCVCGPNDFTLETIRLLNEEGYNGEAVHAFSG